mmetsp:Transcript_47850/g.126801  ORF Transcript_47850/g.126801 Transcript_47850/m.126801 type:complete len:193 (-) Transcript_47850:135-713(-)
MTRSASKASPSKAASRPKQSPDRAAKESGTPGVASVFSTPSRGLDPGSGRSPCTPPRATPERSPISPSDGAPLSPIAAQVNPSMCTSTKLSSPSKYPVTTTRFTAALFNLLVRAMAARGQSPPALCGCIPRPEFTPQGADPKTRPSGNIVSVEMYINRVSDPSCHARNCFFYDDRQKLHSVLQDLLRDVEGR